MLTVTKELTSSSAAGEFKRGISDRICSAIRKISS